MQAGAQPVTTKKSAPDFPGTDHTVYLIDCCCRKLTLIPSLLEQ